MPGHDDQARMQRHRQPVARLQGDERLKLDAMTGHESQRVPRRHGGEDELRLDETKLVSVAYRKSVSASPTTRPSSAPATMSDR